MGKKSSKPPDTVGAAQTEGQYSRGTARDTTYADRPDQVNPFGSVRWGTELVNDPATGKPVTKWTQTEGMSAPVQNLFDNQLETLSNNSNLAAGLNSRINSEMGSAPDWQQFGDVQDLQYDPTDLRKHAEDSAYAHATNRLDPQFETQQNQLEIQLRNQGLRPGDAAYNSQMESFQRSRNDAYEQARLGASGEGRTEANQLWGQSTEANSIANALRNQKIQEYIAKRGFSLGEQKSLDPSAGAESLVGTYSGGQ